MGDAEVQRIAGAGVAGGGAALPHLDAIQRSFGQHDVSGISSHVGGAAADAAGAIGAEAYATGSDVAFAASPSLFVAAHEAAHVVQQRAGVSLLGGVGQAGDSYERQADAVAERVIRGESAEELLDGIAGAEPGPAPANGTLLQRKAKAASGARNADHGDLIGNLLAAIDASARAGTESLDAGRVEDAQERASLLVSRVEHLLSITAAPGADGSGLASHAEDARLALGHAAQFAVMLASRDGKSSLAVQAALERTATELAPQARWAWSPIAVGTGKVGGGFTRREGISIGTYTLQVVKERITHVISAAESGPVVATARAVTEDLGHAARELGLAGNDANRAALADEVRAVGTELGALETTATRLNAGADPAMMGMLDAEERLRKAVGLDARRASDVVSDAGPLREPPTALPLLLREVVNLAARAARGARSKRPSKATVRLTVDVIEALEVIQQISMPAGRLRWDTLEREARAVLVAVGTLQQRLAGTDVDALGHALGATRDAFAAVLPGTLLDVRNWEDPGKLDKLDSGERAKLLELILAQARQRARDALGEIKAAKRPEESGLLQELASTTATDIGYVADEVLRFEETEDREAFQDDVEQTAEAVAAIDSKVKAGQHPWHRSFATLFDAEARLRDNVGLGQLAREYSGEIDPEVAMQQLLAIANEGGGPATATACSTPFQDPDSAIHGIGASLQGVFDRQNLGVQQAERALGEKDPPADPTLFETLLKIAVNVALSAAAGAIGTYVADGTRNALATGAKANAVAAANSNPYLDAALRPELRRHVIEGSMKDGELRRAVVVDAVKDGTKELFKSSFKAVEGHVASAKVGRQPKTFFFTQQQDAIIQARTEAMVQLAHLSSALRQLDLEQLNEFNAYLCSTLPPIAKDEQAQSSLREWLNFEARWQSGAEDGTSRDASLDHARAISGVLEVRVKVDHYDPGARGTMVRSLILRDAEPAALEYLRGMDLRIEDVPINKRYYLSLAGRAIVIAEGPDKGLRTDQLDVQDLAMLKAYASGEVLDGVAFRKIERDPDAYAHVPDADAVAVARELVERVASGTSMKIVEGTA